MEKIGKLKIMFAKYVGKTEGRRKRGRLGHRGDCNIKVDVKGIGSVDWTGLL